METLTEKTRKFLSISYGDGYGSGYGYGYGYGSGYGSGDGDGSGDGSGVKSINGEQIWMVDGIQTVIREVHGNTAKGCILESDLTLRPCFIVKSDNRFAHGETLHQAHESLLSKLFEEYPEEERIAKFREAYPDFDRKIPASELFEWHNRLTGSCLMGRESFCRDKGIDIGMDSFTVREFVNLTKDSYRGDVVRKILEE